jgi:2-polyprenyl-6-methoxyphenol hydroxylase-like FAD-dependent oxidoreductase
MQYDLVVVGGGLTGSSLAGRMASCGARVLLIERETEFRDRVRGESLQPWGVAEARKLGVADALATCSAEMRWFDQFINGERTMHRDIPPTTIQGENMWGFYHPEAQEILLADAAAKGAEVRRGVSVQRVFPGAPPKVRVGAEEIEARLVVLSAGRNPGLRTHAGFAVKRGSMDVLLSGVWLHDLPSDVDADVAYLAYDLSAGSVCGLFQQPGNRARAYFGFHPRECRRLQGDADFPRFRELFKSAAGEAIPFGDAQAAGPIASFECVDVWVEHPYRDGIALAGDAAASNDPCCGQGIALGFRDARLLSDELLADTDWDVAADRYARRHDADYGVVRKVTGWFHDLFQRLGPEADARRARALPLIAQDPTRVPDVIFSGPEVPIHANSRARFFGEDAQAASA